MAGGPNAASLGCWRCAERADRTKEGLETDAYQCSSCGFTFYVNFDAEGPPSAPLWPISAEERVQILSNAHLLDRKRT